jgi:hypothetical protein
MLSSILLPFFVLSPKKEEKNVIMKHCNATPINQKEQTSCVFACAVEKQRVCVCVCVWLSSVVMSFLLLL